VVDVLAVEPIEAMCAEAGSQAKFFSRGSGYDLFLTSTEAVLRPGRSRKSTLRIKLVRSNANPRIEGLDPLPGKSNYFFGKHPKNWRSNVTNYARVNYRNVYPGVDLVFYGNGSQLEYDFVVAAGADPRAIALTFSGAGSIGASLRSLAESSFEHSGPLRNQHWVHSWTDVIAFGIAPLVLAAALVLGILRRNLVLILPAGAAAFSAICLLLIHFVLDKPYPADRTGIYFPPLAGLALAGLAHEWRNVQGRMRVASLAAYVLALIFILQYASEFNTRNFLVWKYDADTRTIAGRLAADRQQNAPLTRIGGSWQLQPALRFYAYLGNWTWAELTTEPPAPGLDYYALLPSERDTVEHHLDLKEIYRGPVSGSVLAKPK